MYIWSQLIEHLSRGTIVEYTNEVNAL